MPNDKGKKRLDDNSHGHDLPSQAKRARVSKACNECRKKKERCDGVQPQCGPCLNLKRTCCFDAQPRRRGLTTGYVRAVEVLLGLMFHSIDGIEHCATAILRGEKSLPACHREPPSLSLINSLADSWRRSGTMKELERLLADIDPGDESELSTRDLYEKLEGAFMNRLRIDDNCNTRIELLSPPPTTSPTAFENGAHSTAPDITPTTLAITHPTPPVTHLTPTVTHPTPPVTHPTRPVPSLRDYDEPIDLPPDWSHLLERYFTDTHTWFPVAPKHDVLRHAFCLANEDPEIGDQESVVSNGDRAALFSTLAYACYRGTLSRHDSTNQFEGSLHKSSSFHLAKKLQNAAMSFLAKAQEQLDYDSGHVQALLILTILQIDQGLLPSAWMTIGQAVYAAILLDIIPSSQRPSQAAVDDKQRRLFLGLYILETLIAYTLERRPYLQGSDLAKVGPLPVDSIEEWEAWRPLDPQHLFSGKRTHAPGRSLSTFNAFLDLVTLLNNQAHGYCTLEETRVYFQLWRTSQPVSQRNAIAALEVASAVTPPQSLNITLASLTIDAVLQIKSVLAEENNTGPAHSSVIPISAHQSLEAVMKHSRVVALPQTCSLMALYMSMIKSQTDIHELPYAVDREQRLSVPVDRFARPSNSDRSLDYLNISASSGSKYSAQPTVSHVG